MAQAIPPEILARIEAHELWLETSKREGQELVQANMDLRNLDLTARQLVLSVLPEAQLDNSLLQKTNLSNASLIGASFVAAKLDGAQLTKADASEAHFLEASLREVQGIGLELLQADLRGADLTGGNFYDANFSGANLEYTNLSQANLRGSFCYKARMAHATLTGSSFGDCVLTGSTGLETAVVEWIDIGDTQAPQRLEGEQARRWLLEQAAAPLPAGASFSF